MGAPARRFPDALLLLAAALMLLAGRARAERPVVDLSIGSPRVESNDFRVEGSGLLGFEWPAVAVEGSGSFETYDVLQTGREQSEQAWAGGAEGRGRWRLTPELVLALGGAVHAAQLSNEAVFFTGSAIDETNQLLRFDLLTGVELTPSGPLALWARAGGGLQHEAYLRTAVTQAGSLRDEDQTTNRLFLTARLESEWSAMPEVLSLASLAEFDSFMLTRTKATMAYDPGVGVAAQADTVPARRLDLRMRLDAVVHAVVCFGVSPYAYFQARYVSTSGAGSSVAVWVPSAGVGVRTVLGQSK